MPTQESPVYHDYQARISTVLSCDGALLSSRLPAVHLLCVRQSATPVLDTVVCLASCAPFLAGLLWMAGNELGVTQDPDFLRFRSGNAERGIDMDHSPVHAIHRQ